MEEHPALNWVVAGSSPASPTMAQYRSGQTDRSAKPKA